ncbi:hypothetical protein LPJ66_010179, partial [Kickxella alabastrina]
SMLLSKTLPTSCPFCPSCASTAWRIQTGRARSICLQARCRAMRGRCIHASPPSFALLHMPSSGWIGTKRRARTSHCFVGWFCPHVQPTLCWRMRRMQSALTLVSSS